MKRLPLFFALAFICLSASAQQFKYDVKFDYIFLNSEFDRSSNVFEKSGTLHAARLTPLVGADWNQGGLARHSIRVGVDLFKNMGEGLPAGDVFREVLLYYNADVPVRRHRGTFSAIAGVFPRSFSEGLYSDAFSATMSDTWTTTLRECSSNTAIPPYMPIWDLTGAE